MGLAAVALLLLAGGGLAVAVLGAGSGRSRRPPRCNGLPELCGRRLDQVVFPATHNSYAASDQRGWRFASQQHGIARQLDDGIRALLLDIHYGVRDQETGRVRTDLRAEGSSRNKVAQQLPPLALRVADGIAGRVGAGTLNGASVPYLCHTLCELGAEPLRQELDIVRRFLARHSGEVVILIVEDYVPEATIDRAFEEAGLTRYVATLDRQRPLPTLGALVASGHRLIVFAEEKGGNPPWYMPAFTFIQDTPLGAVIPSELTCHRYRGDAHNPLLLINHWVPPFPPSSRLNAEIGRPGFLRARVDRCRRERRSEGAIVAVDFYNRSSVVQVARQLNAR
jgi:hypothetical protein